MTRDSQPLDPPGARGSRRGSQAVGHPDKDEAAIAPVVKAIERRLTAFDARPHWGKRFAVSPAEIARLYPRLDDFRSLMQTMDPAGKFRIEMINRLVADSPATAHR